MTRFNLEKLPLCGATTRSGTKCRRRGSKQNGRCKLHGGKSTGAKTRAGKIASSKNALQIGPDWLLGVAIAKKEPFYAETVDCLSKIKTLLLSERFNSRRLNLLVEQHKDAMEVMKFVILEDHGIVDFILLQSALDHYYRNINAEHVKSHVYFPLFTLPQFSIIRSEAQERYLKEWEASMWKRQIDEIDKIKGKRMRNIKFQFDFE